MDVKISETKGRQVAAPKALDDMPKIALPFVLEATGNLAGLFVLDGILIDGLIEQQLLGSLLPTPRLDRPITSVDEGLSQGFVLAALEYLTAEASDQLTGLTAQGPQQDRAALRLALGEGRYDILEAQIDMGPGVKTGRFEIWVPAIPTATSNKALSKPNADMVALLQDCEIEMDARLIGCVAGAQQLMKLEVGSVLPLSKDSLTKVELADSNGNIFGRGRLGQLDGARAVRMTELGHIKPAKAEPVEADDIPAEPKVASDLELLQVNAPDPEPKPAESDAEN